MTLPPVSQRAAAASAESDTDVAIIGMAGRFPGAADVQAFWRNLAAGVESISFFSAEELLRAGVSEAVVRDPKYVPARGVLADAECFDAPFFGVSATEAAVIDPQHRLLLECAWQALEHAGYAPDRCPGVVGVFAGSSASDHAFQVRSSARLFQLLGGYHTQIGTDPDFLTTRISYKLNLKGPSVAVQTACSTSLVAVHLACQSLLDGECDVALAGGVNVSSVRATGYVYQEQGIRSPDGHCRPFDAEARGTVSGSGVGLVVLKPLREAIRAGDFVHAIVRGSAINNDGRLKVGYTAPSVEGQACAIRQAMSWANIAPETIGFVEAHGTGTLIGDPIEVAALTQVFAGGTSRRAFCALGSVKANIGHLSAAAGVAGLIKAVLALEHELIPPNRNFRRPNPEAHLDGSPFYVNLDPVPWRSGTNPRRAGVSSLGIGGTNAHVVLEEAPPRPSSGPSRPWQLLTLSARTPTALERMTRELAAYLTHTPAPLADVAYTLQTGRSAFEHRLVVQCTSVEDARAALETPHGARVYTGVARPEAPEVAFLFPGVGTQYVSMAAQLYGRDAGFRRDFDRCTEIVDPLVGRSLRDVLYPAGSAHEAGAIDSASLVNPAVFVIEYCLASRWMALGVRPAALLGHSLGEYAAATVAGVFTLEDALALVATRGRLMASVSPGAMLAVSMSEQELLPYVDSDVSLASINEPSSCILAGTPGGIERIERVLSEGRTPCRRLKFSHAPHSAMMEPILDRFAEHVRAASPRPPQIPIVSSRTGAWMTPEEAIDPSYWVAHLRHTVRFADALDCLVANGHPLLIEVGPGRSMSRFARRHAAHTAGGRVIPSLHCPEDDQCDLELLAAGLAQCWVAGVPVDWNTYYAEERRQRVPLPTYAFDRRRYSLADIDGSIGPHADAAAPAHDEDGRTSTSTPLEEVLTAQLRLMSAQLDALGH
jgi:acyl transferase domain-containing protein